MTAPAPLITEIAAAVQALPNQLLLREHGHLGEGDELTAVELAAAAEAAAREGLARYVSVAQRSGRSWSEIGRVMGITRQAAEQRFGAASSADTRRCVLCGSEGPLTRAHILGTNNILARLPAAPANTLFLHETWATGPGNPQWQQGPHRTPRSPVDMPVRVLCGDCNRWMAAFEDQVGHVLTSALETGRVDLDVTTQQRIATWVLLTAILSSYLSHDSARFAREFRLSIRQEELPPQGAGVWITHHEEMRNQRGGALHYLGRDARAAAHITGGEHFFYWCVAGPLAFMALVIPTDEPLSVTTKPPGAFTRIWPEPLPFTWPQGRANLADLEGVRMGLARRVTGIVSPPSPLIPRRPTGARSERTRTMVPIEHDRGTNGLGRMDASELPG